MMKRISCCACCYSLMCFEPVVESCAVEGCIVVVSEIVVVCTVVSRVVIAAEDGWIVAVVAAGMAVVSTGVVARAV